MRAPSVNGVQRTERAALSLRRPGRNCTRVRACVRFPSAVNFFASRNAHAVRSGFRNQHLRDRLRLSLFLLSLRPPLIYFLALRSRQIRSRMYL